MASGGVVCATDINQARAFRASDGAQLWTFKLQGVGAVGSAAMTPDAVYFAVVPLTKATPYDIYALRSADGKTIWKVPLSGQGIAVTSRMVYVGVEQNSVISLRAFRTSDGTQAWKFPASVLDNPVVNGDVVYVLSTSPPVLHAIRASNGAPIWRSSAPFSEQVVIGGNTICALGSTFSAGQALWVWRASDGKILWKSGAGGGYVSAAIAGNVVYAVNDSSELVALDASDGTKIWGFPVDGHIAPTVSGHLIYAGRAGGGLVALRTSNGKPVWQSPTYFTEGPVVGANAIYVSDGHKVYALRM
jgi:outer membrane protein assembly factor BamB